jgi:SAM-dependent methyltransferase
MPPVEQWESYFEPGRVLDALSCRGISGDAVEFGCGYGTFTLAAAPRVSGTVFATDIDPRMVSATRERASTMGAANVVVERRDFVAQGSGRPDCSMRYVLLLNILHLEAPVALLREAFRILRPDGTVGVIHWRGDRETPRGPPPSIRPSPAQCREWAQSAGLDWCASPDLPGAPWHWGMTLKRPAA